jgi:multiple sugar transport system permease protein
MWARLGANRNWLGFWFMAPAAAFLILFLTYPLGLGILAQLHRYPDRPRRGVYR